MDYDEQCSYRAGIGECNTNFYYMLVMCAKSCGLGDCESGKISQLF